MSQTRIVLFRLSFKGGGLTYKKKRQKCSLRKKHWLRQSDYAKNHCPSLHFLSQKKSLPPPPNFSCKKGIGPASPIVQKKKSFPLPTFPFLKKVIPPPPTGPIFPAKSELAPPIRFCKNSLLPPYISFLGKIHYPPPPRA